MFRNLEWNFRFDCELIQNPDNFNQISIYVCNKIL